MTATRRAFLKVIGMVSAVMAFTGNLWAAIADTFSGSLSNWTVMRGTFDTSTNAGQLTVTGLHATDGDAGIIYSNEQTATNRQWVEVKITSIPALSGDCSGPFVLCSAASSTANHVWLR